MDRGALEGWENTRGFGAGAATVRLINHTCRVAESAMWASSATSCAAVIALRATQTTRYPVLFRCATSRSTVCRGATSPHATTIAKPRHAEQHGDPHTSKTPHKLSYPCPIPTITITTICGLVTVACFTCHIYHPRKRKCYAKCRASNQALARRSLRRRLGRAQRCRALSDGTGM